MNSQPLVSVVLIFFNTQEYLREAIEGVLRQVYQNWELLLVDDGSEDGSTEIARRYEAAHPGRIRYLHHPGHDNRGVSATRNLGIREARGELVSFLDSDDIWLPELLARQVEEITARPEVAMVYGPVERWYSWSGDPADSNKDFVARPLEEYDVVLNPPSLIPIMLQESFGVPLGFLLRREAIREIGGYEDEFRGMFDDQVFLSKLALKHPVFVMHDQLYRYRRHPDSMVTVTGKSGKKTIERERFLSWLDRHLREEEVRDPEVLKALRREQWASAHPWLAAKRREMHDLANRVGRRIARTWGNRSALIS